MHKLNKDMQHKETIEETISAYIDGTCSIEKAIEVEQLIATDKNWKQAFDADSAVHLMLQTDFEPMEPSLRFSKNVMEQIASLKIAPATRQYLNHKIVYFIGGAFVLLLIGLLGYAISLADFGSSGSKNLIPIPSIKVPSIEWGQYLNENSIYLILTINVLLCFLLIDHWVRNKKTGATT